MPVVLAYPTGAADPVDLRLRSISPQGFEARLVVPPSSPAPGSMTASWLASLPGQHSSAGLTWQAGRMDTQQRQVGNSCKESGITAGWDSLSASDRPRAVSNSIASPVFLLVRFQQGLLPFKGFLESRLKLIYIGLYSCSLRFHRLREPSGLRRQAPKLSQQRLAHRGLQRRHCLERCPGAGVG